MVNDLLMDTKLAPGEAGTGFSNFSKPAPNAQFYLAGRSNAGA